MLIRKKPKPRQPGKKLVSAPFPVVGVGASAGGLEAFMELFRSLPSDTGLAFILIQHLSPKNMSILSSLVQKATRMKVEEIRDRMKVVSNCVYVIPPNATLEIFHGVLHLSSMPEPHAGCLPVNQFFHSLARDCGNLAIGVVLSGTGSDGADGLKEIKAEGGITFVQEPKGAKFDGMPRAAIAASTPDHVLSVQGIARELVHIAGHPIVKKAAIPDETAPTPEAAKILQKIFILLRSATKIDFSTYKYPTISRRIKRRMVLHQVDSLSHYLTYLQEQPLEVRALFEDLLINVTEFFRDPDAFESLKTTVFPAIMKDRPATAPIRVWIPGCSTGEEVYSIAIALLEYLGDTAPKYSIQIYGTDICESAIKIARLGLYPETASRTVSPARLDRYFRAEQGGYRISKLVRDCCIFSIQDVTSHPPLNRLDLLSCRNLMIYLGPAVQKKLMDTFFYALNSNGYLMLGAAESVGAAANLFGIVNKRYKIYLKKAVTSHGHWEFQTPSAVSPSKALPATLADSAQRSEIPLKLPLKRGDPVAEAERQVLDRFAPAWVLVNAAMEIVQFRGTTAPYIEPARGQPTWSLMKMLHRDISADVRILLHSALKEGRAFRKNGIQLKQGTLRRIVDVEVSPVMTSGSEDHYLILFTGRESAEPTPPLKGKRLKTTRSKTAASLLVKQNEILQDELVQTQNSLQAVIEDQNATNEEMQSANEEVMSANEELQSTNEELETAKEELQSTNEELTTLNDELSSRNAELDLLSNDLVNLLGNANVSIVMVGLDMRIRRFTPMAEKLLKLIAGDVGRNLTDINLGFGIEHIEENVAEVIRNLSTIEVETQDREGDWYSIRFRPYKTLDNKIDGAVLVFVNIHEAKTRERLWREAEALSDGIIQTVRDPLVVLDEALRVKRANQAFYDIFNLKTEQAVGRLFYELDDHSWDIPELRDLLENVLPKELEVRNFKVRHRFKALAAKTIVLNARRLEWEGKKKILILITLDDTKAIEKLPS